MARFALAMVVAVGHLGEYAELGWLGAVARMGAFEAIMGFLIISGYSIGVSYRRKPVGFLKRRIARLYPIYLASIVLAFFARNEPWSLTLVPTLVINALFLNQLLSSISYVGPAWSLSLEFWLYCFAPWLHRKSRVTLRCLIYGSLLAYLVYTVGRSMLDLPYYSNVGGGLNLLVLAFMWICGFSMARRPRQGLRDAAWLMFAHMALCSALQCGFRLKHADLATFFSLDVFDLLARCSTLAGIWLLFACILSDRRSALEPSRVMRFLGDISYPLYLMHLSVFQILAKYIGGHTFALLGAAMVAAGLSYKILDVYSQRRPVQTRAIPAEARAERVSA